MQCRTVRLQIHVRPSIRPHRISGNVKRTVKTVADRGAGTSSHHGVSISEGGEGCLATADPQLDRRSLKVTILVCSSVMQEFAIQIGKLEEPLERVCDGNFIQETTKEYWSLFG